MRCVPCGWVAIVGGVPLPARFTVNAAPELVTDPMALATVTEYVPAWSDCKFIRVSMGPVAPAICWSPPPLLKNHW